MWKGTSEKGDFCSIYCFAAFALTTGHDDQGCKTKNDKDNKEP